MILPTRGSLEFRPLAAVLFGAFFALGGFTQARAAAPIALTVDASTTPTTSVVHVHEVLPATGSALDLSYPRWVPGEHSPSGPIANVGGLTVEAVGTRLAWQRDIADPNEFHIAVPTGATSVAIDFDFLGSTGGNYSGARLATNTILAINWNQFLLYPSHGDIATLTVAPTIVLPGSDWTAETALPSPVRTGNTIAYAPATIERLVDSPLDAGTAFKRFTLLDADGYTNEIDAFADRPDQLALSEPNQKKFSGLVGEMDALYGARHWKNYHFLLTVSDEMPGNGVEHGSSSDDGQDGKALTDPEGLIDTAGLLAHEFNHSWDGKYRRPADLATANFQVPEGTDLLWIYEGMTQLYGDLIPTRAGLWTAERFREALAAYYVQEDSEPGRATRPLADTATAASFLYGAPRSFAKERRTAGDFYVEGALLWLDVDARLHELGHGAKSLDGFCKRFFGETTTPSIVKPYTYEQFLAALDAYAPYDWKTYFATRVYAPTAHPPSPFESLGWKLVFTEKPNAVQAASAKARKSFDIPVAVGVIGNGKGEISDVIAGSPAARGGLGVGDTIVAVNGREFDPETFVEEIKATKAVTTPLALIVRHGKTFRTVAIDYHGGLAYPHLARIPERPDILATIVTAHRAMRP